MKIGICLGNYDMKKMNKLNINNNFKSSIEQSIESMLRY